MLYSPLSLWLLEHEEYGWKINRNCWINFTRVAQLNSLPGNCFDIMVLCIGVINKNHVIILLTVAHFILSESREDNEILRKFVMRYCKENMYLLSVITFLLHWYNLSNYISYTIKATIFSNTVFDCVAKHLIL